MDQTLLDYIKTINLKARRAAESFDIPKYSPDTHFLDVATSDYYHNLLLMRDVIKHASDSYMRSTGAINVDLFMLTTSVSSPMGPGSDSEPLPIDFGGKKAYLTDSSQFGFEPIMINGIDRAYCYLPSLRGEIPDKRHLNQFYHCEIEVTGTFQEVKKIAEGYVNFLIHALRNCEQLIRSISRDPDQTMEYLRNYKVSDYEVVEFDKACSLLDDNGCGKYVNHTKHGRDISALGEMELARIMRTTKPFWIVNFDRDRVPFYQKPDPQNEDKVINGDLIFPPLIKDGFGGEILGAGQRQDDYKEMMASMKRQNVDSRSYSWYAELRKLEQYKQTSGFGMGIERFIAWTLGLENIRDAIIYPREKGKNVIP